MTIQNIPQKFLQSKKHNPELYVYDFKMTEDAINSKVNLTLNMFSFLQTGEKKVQFDNTFVEVNNKQSVLIKSGNCLMTELLTNDEIYFCKLFFFTNENVQSFLNKHPNLVANQHLKSENVKPFFVIENDEFINSFVTSISSILHLKTDYSSLLFIKFEEIMLYLAHKYGTEFISYIQALSSNSNNSTFKNIVEANVYSNLSLLEISFLANMSLSTFKRNFAKEYNANPGKWLQQKRLHHAKDILEKGAKKPSEIFANYGYTSFSNFSIAFKNEFGVSPKSI
ncbi:MAG: AraC family transcriptional regulator [Ferruginibacter sp.]|nr:helix-turn-helix transcriptional regulator [Ferruginibacter sp.]